MTFYIRLFILISCFSIPTGTFAYNLRQITGRDGLSNSSVFCLFQDTERFLWIGTFDGLNRYDGRNIRIYKPDINNRYSLSSNVIRNMVETKGDYLWINTKWGLNKFSKKEDMVVEYHTEFKENSYISTDSNGNLYVYGKPGILSFYDESQHAFIDLPIRSDRQFRQISGLFTDTKDTIWINHGGTLEKYTISFPDKNRPQLHRNQDYPHPRPIRFVSFSRERVIFTDTEGDLYSIDTGKTIFIRNISSLIKENGQISSIIYDDNDLLIGFTTNGLIRLQAKNNYKEENIEINCGVFSLRKDEKQNIVWIGTDGQGVYAWTKEDYTFRNLTLSQLPVKKQRPVRALFTDSLHNLWMGTKDNGVICIKEYANKKDYAPEDIIHYTTENGLNNNNVFAFEKSPTYNVLWMGSDGPGISYYSYRDQKIHKLKNHTANTIIQVHSLIESRDSTLWIASGNSLLKMKIESLNHQLNVNSSQRFQFELKNNQPYNQIYSLYPESDSIIWIGVRGNGIIRFNSKTETYKLISFEENGIAPMNDVLCIFRDDNCILWVGTSYGLIRLEMFPDGSYKYKNYNENDGLPNNTIHGILDASDGKLWLSSNTGIILFDPKSGSFRNFNHKTGLKTVEFCDNAYFIEEQTGLCFFGGVDGVVEIKKEETEHEKFIPQIRFTKVRIFNNDYRILDFEREENGIPYIELKNKQNFFAISFTALDFMNGMNNSYSYRLENFSDVWMETYSNEAQFTNIAPGSYTLRVKYNAGTDEDEGRIQSLRIVILPPWYLTVYAKITYILLAVGAVVGIFHYIKRRYEKRKRNADLRLEQKYKEEMYEGKLRFFTNITHEFSTPLTLIHGPCERILSHDNIDPFIKKYTQIIKSNTERLNALIQEIIDFRRIETGNKPCRIEKTNVGKLTWDIAASFNEMAEQNHIRFNIISSDTEWNTDKDYYMKIASNLISNAFKYTPEGGCIRVSVEEDGKLLKLKVYNTGKGIPEENIPLIFNRYSVLDNVKENSIKGLSSRNGLGLAICHSLTESLHGTIQVESKINEYAEFTVILPWQEPGNMSPENTIAETTTGKSISPIYKPTREGLSTPAQKINGQSKEHILIIDDNRDLLWMLKDILSDEYIIHAAENGKEGLEMLKKEMPDLIITDIMMPGIDGITLTQQIKRNRHTMHIPLVILSAKNSNEDKITGIESGADAYVSKPFHAEYLKTVVRHQIKNKKNLEEYYNSSAGAFEFNNGRLLQKEDKEFLLSVADAIHQNMDNNGFSPEQLAECLQIGLRNLYRRLKELNQSPPNEFIKEIRIKQAAKLMVTSTLTVQEVMYKVGFSNRSHFYKEFSKRYGKTPKEYRESNKEKDDSLG